VQASVCVVAVEALGARLHGPKLLASLTGPLRRRQIPKSIPVRVPIPGRGVEGRDVHVPVTVVVQPVADLVGQGIDGAHSVVAVPSLLQRNHPVEPHTPGAVPTKAVAVSVPPEGVRPDLGVGVVAVITGDDAVAVCVSELKIGRA